MRSKATRVGVDSRWKSMDRLEPRTLMDHAPLPDISDLTNPSDTVIRLETNYGDIDIELFDAAAPITVANFLKYVRDGDLDKTFFHRLDDDFVLQGGLARLLTGANGSFGAQNIPLDAAILNEFNQSNLRGTVAMARVGGQVNSATSQFFFNLVDNTFLDTVDQGFTVFGRILGSLDNATPGTSWATLMAINALNVRNEGSPYNESPVSDDFAGGNGYQEDELVVIVDAEVIKPANVAAFYTFRYYYPEGFAGSTINEFVILGNPGDVPVTYQLVVHAERSQTPSTTEDFWFRDKVIRTATVPANTRRGVTVSSFSDSVADLVDQGLPFAFEIWATGPLAAQLSHYDFGTATGEAFATVPGVKWTLADVRKGDDIRDFVIWQNTGDEAATVTVTFIFSNQPAVSITRTTEAFRRGGLNLSQIGSLPDGIMSVQVTSNQPIVSALTHFDSSGEVTGSATLGIPGDGLHFGVLPLGDVGTDLGEEISFINPSATQPAIIRLTFSFSDGSPDFVITPGSLIIQARRRGTLDLSTLPQLDGKRFSIRYETVGALDTPVFMHTLHTEHGDALANPAPTTAATNIDFAEGFMNHGRAGVDLFETLSFYNPNFDFFGTVPATANITVRFYYNSGFVLPVTFNVDGGARLDVNVHELQAVLDQSRDNRRFFYSIEVVSNIPIVAQFRHFDLTLGDLQPSGGFSTTGIQRGIVLSLDDIGMGG